MSWLARSLADSLGLEHDGAMAAVAVREEEEEREERENDGPGHVSATETDSRGSLDRDRNGIGSPGEGESANECQSRGVKEDINDLTQSLSRQLRGVANFLAPAPSQPTTPSYSDPGASEWDRFLAPVRPSNCSSGDMEKGAMDESSNPLNPIESEGECTAEEEEEEEEFEGVELAGVTDEVLTFARNVAMHPETWLDFPLDAEDDLDDFKMTEAQKEHTLAIENLAPRLRALRIELCPCHMSKSYFWKVYFVLLHTRLEKHDADILSTPQVMEARAMWMKELKRQTHPESDWPERNEFHLKVYEHDGLLQDEVDTSSPNYFTARCDHFRPLFFKPEMPSTLMHGVIEDQPSACSEAHIVNNPSTGGNTHVEADNKDSPTMRYQSCDADDDDDIDWPEEEDSDLVGYNGVVVSMGMEDEISFSDLEDDSDIVMPIRSKPVSYDQERGSS